jgi:NTE family protein
MEVDQSALYGRRQGDCPSILGVAGINHVLQEMLGDRTFEELKIPCALTAVDLEAESEVILRHGPVVGAVLATIAIPGIFPPQPWEGHHLVDGGLLDPVPVQPARGLASRLPVVAVVLSSTTPQPGNILDPPTMVGSNPLLKEIARLRIGQAFNIFLRSIDVGSRYMTLLRLQLDRPDAVIIPELPEIGILDRVDMPDLFRRGRLAAEKALPELKKANRWPRRWRRMRTEHRGRTHRS